MADFLGFGDFLGKLIQFLIMKTLDFIIYLFKIIGKGFTSFIMEAFRYVVQFLRREIDAIKR